MHGCFSLYPATVLDSTHHQINVRIYIVEWEIMTLIYLGKSTAFDFSSVTYLNGFKTSQNPEIVPFHGDESWEVKLKTKLWKYPRSTFIYINTYKFIFNWFEDQNKYWIGFWMSNGGLIALLADAIHILQRMNAIFLLLYSLSFFKRYFRSLFISIHVAAW